MGKISETITENIFRKFYGNEVFIEKSAIPNHYGFMSKNGTKFKGYPDFFKDLEEYSIIVEAKAVAHEEAEEEVNFYMEKNKITKDIIGIAVSGQIEKELKVTYFYKNSNEQEIKKMEHIFDCLLTLEEIKKNYRKIKYGDSISNESLNNVLKELNKKFHKDGKVRDSDRSLFFSGLMIALNNLNFRNTYKSIQAPTKEETSTTKAIVLEAHNLNNAIINAISSQLTSKINNLSKEFSWKDKFSFIKNIDYSLLDYIQIINTIETMIFNPFKNDEKQDILGRAYKIFLSRAGKAENKNIILTPDHIKQLMVKLARLTKDDVVLDTCTGSGGFLMESMETMINLANGDIDKINNIKEKQLIGFEVDSVLFSLACSNMFLHGDGKTNLLYRSSLLSNNQNGSALNEAEKDLVEYIKKLKPTKIIINPPYETNNSIKFTKQALDYLEQNGKLIIIMPTPTLTQNQNNITKKILEVAKLDFVIRMPTNLFSEQKRTVNTSIFGFTKTPHSEDDIVLFYNLEDDGFVSIQNKGKIDKNNTWSTKEEHILKSIKQGDNIPDILEKRTIYKDGKLNCNGVTLRVNSSTNMAQIKDIFDIDEGTLASSECNESGEFNFITTAAEWKKHNSYSHDCEAIVYAVNSSGSLGRSHYVNGKFIASNLCLILKLKEDYKEKINPHFYSHYFNVIRKKMILDLADGTSKLTISQKDLEEYYVEIFPKDKQDDFVNKNIVELNKLKEQVKAVEDKLTIDIKNII